MGNDGRISSYLDGAFIGRSAGAVHSCFHTSFNFTLGDRLIHAGPDCRPLCCFGMELPGDRVRALLQAIAPGDLVSCRDGRIAVYGRNEIFTLHADQMEMVDLRIENGRPHEGAALCELLQELDLDGQLGIEKDEPFRRCCRTLEAFARSAVVLGGSAGLGRAQGVSAEGASARPGSVQDISTGLGRAEGINAGPSDTQGVNTQFARQSGPDSPGASIPSLSEAISWLIGRGQGLTPSGDDILLGYGAGLLALDPSGAGRLFLNTLSGCLHGQTTDISLGYFRGLAAGCVNENMKLLLRGFWNNDRGDTKRWLESVRAVGHTSGCDTLFGLRLVHK